MTTKKKSDEHEDHAKTDSFVWNEALGYGVPVSLCECGATLERAVDDEPALEVPEAVAAAEAAGDEG